MRKLLLILIFIVGMSGWSLPVLAQTRLWRTEITQQLDDITALYATPTQVFTGLTNWSGQGYSPEWRVQAISVAMGTVQWQDVDPALLAPEAIFAYGNYVAGVGNGPQKWVVRMYRADTGARVWQDVIPTTATPPWICQSATTVHFYSNYVHVGGCLNGKPVVRTYDLASGKLLWKFTLNTTGVIRALLVWAGKLLAVHDTGRIDSLFQNTGGMSWTTAALAGKTIQTAGYSGDVVVLVGQKTSTAGGQAYTRAVNRYSGKLLWERLESATPSVGWKLLVADKVYVGGGITTDGRTRYWVQTYALTTGQPGWRVVSTAWGDASEGENVVQTMALDSAKKRLYIGLGLTDIEARVSADAATFALDSTTGTPVWSIIEDGSIQEWDWTRKAALTGSTLVLGGVRNWHGWEADKADVVVECWNPTPVSNVAAR